LLLAFAEPFYRMKRFFALGILVFALFCIGKSDLGAGLSHFTF
jgi:hypothetical protein